ncbi:hypothetical protein [Microbacterium sp. Marseille-Q6965]|uniref:hypothetical protein n=1 Tax=Microbacterium sp. Marseille-Q6965 TaxID=2965072 RepID=UPI0021B75C36|nr:hypothetical protein [Microbacterium sp. Marseille-Q6965]
MHTSTASADSRAARRRARERRRSRLIAFLTAPSLVLGMIGLGVWGATAASAAALPAPAASIALQDTGGAHGDADAKAFILAGEDATFDVALRNTSDGTGGYNIGFTLAVPNGVHFVSSGMGAPAIYDSGDTLPNSSRTPPLDTVPEGTQLWVFEDVADLPANADYSSTITVRPDAEVFPVGAEIDVALTGHVSGQASVKPIFDGSTGVGAAAAREETSSGADAASVPVKALRLTKHEPSPEIELLRGVHDHHTVYTLTVENTPQGATEGVTVVDYLPAGLEFLGCAQVDNTRPSSLLSDGTREYAGAGPLTGTAPADCVQPATVETVNSGLPADLTPGVYTKVTWNLPPVAGGTAQAMPDDAGTAGVTVIRYAAAVPLYENTMDFVADDGSGTPPVGGAQAANLNNNNGPSTRQGQGGAGDGIAYTNAATVSGTYAGARASGTEATVSDTDTERIQAMDLRILESVDTDPGPETSDEFRVGEIATFTFDIATGEYASADGMTVTATFPNGLCPVIPNGDVEVTGDEWPSDCPYPPTSPDAALSGATLEGIHYDAAAGEFTLTFTPDPGTIAANGSLQIITTALMRAHYTTHPPYVGSTSSGDALDVRVEIEGVTHPVDAVADPADPAAGEEDVWDDSSDEITSGLSDISKRVLSREAVLPGATAEASCAVPADDAAWSENHTGADAEPFVPGDVVCYELRVDFASQIDVRNPLITDFLPSGVEYLDWAAGPGTSEGLNVPDPTVTGQRLDWAVGNPGAEGDRFVPMNSVLVLHVLGTVTSWTPNDEATLDKPENLMKYQQENVLGRVFFDRDASAIQTAQGPTLVKGVRDVDGDAARPAGSQQGADGASFGSNRDGIEVAARDVVTYRIDLTGGTTDVTDLVVWDALPEGVTKDDVSAVEGGIARDPGDAGYPASIEQTGRSVVMWTGIDLAAAAQHTLTYAVAIPADVLVNVDLDNTASITQYDVPLNTGETATFYPAGSLDGTDRDPADEVPGSASRDDSAVHTPAAAMSKRVVSTEISPGTANLDPRNGATDVVQGELITYEYSVTIPAGTSVRDAVLRDAGLRGPQGAPLPLEITDDTDWSSTALTGATRADFSFPDDADGRPQGVLTFPQTYTNSSDEPQVFTVTLTGYLPDDAGNNGATLTNEARFDSLSWEGNATATVTYREPNLGITKAADRVTDVGVGTPVTYTLSVTNDTNRVASYDNVVVDTVPAGLVVDPTSFSTAPSAVDDGVYAGAGGTITWRIAQVPPTATITYRAEIDPRTGAGAVYDNTAVVTGHTLPESLPDAGDRRGDRTDDAAATIEAATARIAKGVRLAETTDAYTDRLGAPIGDTVQYEVDITLQPNINYYEPTIADDLPSGVELIDSSVNGPETDSSIDGAWTRSHDPQTNTWRWTYDGDIAAAAEVRTLTLRYEVLLSESIGRSVSDLPNTATFSWNTVDGDEAKRSSIEDGATVDVLDPVPAIEKTVSDRAPEPGQRFDYTVTVTNTGTTPAHDLVVQDEVPDGVIVDPTTISHGGTLTGQGATGGGTIAWDATDLPGPLQPAGSGSEPEAIALTYTAELAPSAALSDDDVLVNTARVTRLESFPSGGRVYEPGDVEDTASVEPAFPHVILGKSATAGDTAYAGESFGWTLTLRNDGDGAADTIGISDVLPRNWEFDAGSAQIRVGTGAARPLADPEITVTGGVQSLEWAASAVTDARPALPGAADGATAAQRTIVVTYTATPAEAALTDAGVTGGDGVRVPHTNTLSATTTDTSGVTENASGPYTGPDAAADAFIHAADLALVKEAGDGLVAGGPAATAWTITVTNDGPDAAVGPFTVADDWGTLPEGLTVTGVAGDGWTVTRTDEGFTAVRTNAADTLADGATFPALTVTAQAVAGFDLAEAPVPNQARVSAGTFDPDPDNNDDAAEVPVTAAADLTIDKTGPAAAPNAGAPISWTLTVTNDGPSDSVSSDTAPITVSDTIPDGVEGVTVGTLPDGWTSDATGPLGAGDTLTLTLGAGQRLTPAQAAAFVLTGTVSASLPEGTDITNSATVTPGATDDPEPANNEDATTTMPTTDTRLAVAKTRQVLDGGAWRDATDADETVPGAPVSYLLTVANVGTADARGVALVDEVAEYVTYAAFESVTGAWTRTSIDGAAGDDQRFVLADPLAPGATAALRITLEIDAAYDDEVVNWVEGSAENATNRPRADDGSGATRHADLAIQKSHDGTVVAGGTLRYRLEVTNQGPSYSSGPIVVADELPAGFGYAPGTATVSVAGGPAVAAEPAVTGSTLEWSVGDGATTLGNGSTILVEFTATVAADVAAGTHLNVGTVSGPDDTDPSNNVATDPTTVTTSADVSVVKTAAAGTYVAGETATYTITVDNAGPSVARDVAVHDAVPAGMTVTAMSGADWACDADAALCERDVMPVGRSTITVTAEIASSVPHGTALRNVATVTSSTPDPTGPVSDDDTIDVTASADLALAKTAIDADGSEITTAAAGADVRYLLQVTNSGSSDAVGPLTITDALPQGFTFVSVADGARAWTCVVDEAGDASFTCSSPDGLPAGQAATPLVVIATIDPAQPVGTAVNHATVSSPTADPVPDDNADDAPLDVTQSADLSIVKSHEGDAVRIGNELTFALDVSNAGPSTAAEVTVTDTLPAGLRYVGSGASDPAWSVTAAPTAEDGTTTVTAVLDVALAPQTAAPLLQIATRVEPGAYPDVTNVATVAGAQPDPMPEDNTSEDRVSVPAQAALVLTKDAVGDFQVGSDAEYALTVTNLGVTEDPGPIVVEDALPEGLVFRGVTGDGVMCADESGTVRCTLEGALAVGATVAVMLQVGVEDAAFPSVSNTATVASPTEQLPTAVTSATVVTTVAADPLAATDAPVAAVWIALALLLVLLGAVLTVRRRRRAA